MRTVLTIVGALLVCGPFFVAFVRTFCMVPPEQPADADDVQPDSRAWMDERIAAETHPGRRMAWRLIRHNDLEGL